MEDRKPPKFDVAGSSPAFGALCVGGTMAVSFSMLAQHSRCRRVC